ncbi:myb/SANT-like DNA-binding domain-containing protein 4 [Homarus americanus]|uniref:myb/SANT-like DNA-binding domain-containing protein 4 n=1 Tax=Homarus americanus TaxID=6706 RepID=UPI001C46A6BE|nr:myb/SANT-like DNA-binding domain-containing protein 4 [Homarus americanus]
MDNKPHLKRRPNFSEAEKIMLVKEVMKRRKVLLGKSESIVPMRLRMEAWDSIASAINGVNPAVRQRERNELKKKFTDFKSSVKKDLERRRKALLRGVNDPEITPLTPSEEAMAALISYTSRQKTKRRGYTDGCESEASEKGKSKVYS